MMTKRHILLIALFLSATLQVLAQLQGTVVDAQDGAPVPYATVQYRGNRIATRCDGQGRFRIERHNGWRLTFSSVGYREQVLNVGPQTAAQMTIRLSTDNHTLSEVTIKSKKKTRYRRKDNPAVELMRKVIANKKKADLKRHDYYSYQNYQKIMLGLNDLSPELLEKGIFKKYPWLREQVDTSQYTDKMVLPLTVDEMVTQHLYRRDPKTERVVVKGTKSSGVNDLFQTGEILTNVMREVFADVDIYDDYIPLMRHKFSSPIGRDAIQFYRYYITDTVYVGPDRCIHLDFVPNNQQDFGFRGQIYILDDTTYQVKRCELHIPRSSDVNWVESMQCMQEFARQPDGEWLLTIDDMVAELMVTDFITKAVVTRTTRLTDFSFDPLPAKQLKGHKPVVVEQGADHRDDAFWDSHRQVEFTKSERGMGNFLSNIEKLKGYRYAIFVLKALFENYLETGSREQPSKFDVGPINTMISQNFYDGMRLRLSGQTTANLHPHLFAKGYYAYGTKTRENYYNAELTYSFDRKQYLPQEFPVNKLSFSSKRDVALPSDKFAVTDKDNVFSSFKVDEIDKMLMYNTQRLSYEYETPTHWRFSADLKTEKIASIGNIRFAPLLAPKAPPSAPEGATIVRIDDYLEMISSNTQTIEAPSGAVGGALPSIRYTESTFGLRYAPDEKFVNTKQRRRAMNKDAWYISLQHTIGYNHFLGGQYNYNYTELEWYRRTWLPMSWGRIDTRLKICQQWNQVPWPLLPMPQANLSYVVSPSLFNMVNNMEFMNDRFASLMLTWEMGGKLLNRIPLLRHLKLREILELKCLWGTLSDKNNPMLERNTFAGISNPRPSTKLMAFPEGCYVMDGRKPYWEYAIGVQNILSLIQIEYVHRINYLNLPTAQKHGIRFVINPTF